MYGISGFSNPFFSGVMTDMPNQSYGYGGNQYNIGHNSGLIIGENSGPLNNNSNMFGFGGIMGMPQMGGYSDPYGMFGNPMIMPQMGGYIDPYGMYGNPMTMPQMGGYGGSNQSSIGLNNGVAIGSNYGYIDNRRMPRVPEGILWGGLVLDLFRELNRNQVLQ